MIVLDASTLVAVLTDRGQIGETTRGLMQAATGWGCVDHTDAEVFSAVRGLVLGRKLSSTAATAALTTLTSWQLWVVPTRELFSRMWELRDNLSGYDAAYIAAAEVLGCPLVTADAHLAAAPGVRCDIRLVA